MNRCMNGQIVEYPHGGNCTEYGMEESETLCQAEERDTEEYTFSPFTLCDEAPRAASWLFPLLLG